MSTTYSNILNKIRAQIVKYSDIENLKKFNDKHGIAGTAESRYFSRNRKMTFADMLAFIIYPRSESMNIELLKYSHLIEKSNVNKSDFSRRRRHIPASYIKELNRDIINVIYAGDTVDTWHGHLLLAGDGTTYTLPDTPGLREIYLQGRKTGNSAQALSRGVVVKDVLNDLILASNMECYGDDEIHLLMKELDTLPESVLCRRPIMTLDRKYCSYLLLHKLISLGMGFVIRVKKRFNKVVDKFMDSGKEMEDVSLTPAQESIRKLHSLYGPGDYSHFNVRLVRITDDVTVMTSVTDTNEFGRLREIYFGRWDVETTIGFEKNSLQVEIFSGTTQNAMQQDFHAKTIDYNILSLLVRQAAMLRHDSGQANSRKNGCSGKINRNVALGIFALNYRWCLPGGKSHNHNICLNSMLKEMARFIVPYQKKRHNPRIFRNIKTSGKYITLPNYRRAI